MVVIIVRRASRSFSRIFGSRITSKSRACKKEHDGKLAQPPLEVHDQTSRRPEFTRAAVVVSIVVVVTLPVEKQYTTSLSLHIITH
jgi:hypothetical protein